MGSLGCGWVWDGHVDEADCRREMLGSLPNCCPGLRRMAVYNLWDESFLNLAVLSGSRFSVCQNIYGEASVEILQNSFGPESHASAAYMNRNRQTGILNSLKCHNNSCLARPLGSSIHVSQTANSIRSPALSDVAKRAWKRREQDDQEMSLSTEKLLSFVRQKISWMHSCGKMCLLVG